jgi:hypothetical protein
LDLLRRRVPEMVRACRLLTVIPSAGYVQKAVNGDFGEYDAPTSYSLKR